MNLQSCDVCVNIEEYIDIEVVHRRMNAIRSVQRK